MVGPGHGVDIYASSVLGLGGFGLSPAALELADALLQAPLASRAELRVFSGLAKSSVGRSRSLVLAFLVVNRQLIGDATALRSDTLAFTALSRLSCWPS